MGFAWEIFPDDRYAIMRVPGTNWCAADHSYGDDGTRYTEFLPAYSTDLAAAWLVVEKIRDTTDGDETWVSLFDDGANGWRCVILYNLCAGKDAPVEIADELAPTAPLAICRAALKSVADEVPA
jgi:hypothetical protein